MDYREIAALTKTDSFTLATLPEEVRDRALKNIAAALEANKERILKPTKKILRRATICRDRSWDV